MSRIALIPFALAAALAALPAAAQDPRDAGHDRNHDHRRDDRRALADAVRRIERETRGEVLSAERVPFDGRDVSRVKVVDASGRVRVYMDDPHVRHERQPTRTRGHDGNSD
ncbi:hypothetical protein ACFFGH_02885 [Lysobacter korlensis]|uniref:PepSY domain-containing protein n=1 Tax=Lysobacter korlensis TaxID=553636 RepID=A0ABV6RLK2_9GAMM